MSRAEETNDDKARFLTDTEIWGDAQGKGQLQVMKRYGTKTGMSDLAVLLGSAVSKYKTTEILTTDGDILKYKTTIEGQRAGPVWSASSDGGGDVRAVNSYGGRSRCLPAGRGLGARPALPSLLASSIGLSEAKPSRKFRGVDIVENGEYPQTIADKNTLKELEGLSEAQLKKMETGKTYTFESRKHKAYDDNAFDAKEHAEYQHKGKKYIRVEATPCGYPYDKGYSMLSNGEQAIAGQSYWVEVQPIEWLRDPSGIFVTRQGILGGLQIQRYRNYDRYRKYDDKYYDGNFKNTDIYRYLNNILMKEIQPSKKELGAAPVTPPAKFLTETELWGDAQGKGQLQVMKLYGTKTGMSDLAVLLGGAVSKSNTTIDGQRAGPVWSASSNGDGGVRAVNSGGDRDYDNPDERSCGARPALSSLLASLIGLSAAKPSRKISGVANTEIDVVEYGEYPQTIADENTLKELEQAFSRNQLQKTGKTYNFDSEERKAYDKPFNAKEHAEYQHKGKKYIRVQATPTGELFSMLSNGEQAVKWRFYWVEVQPIEWLRDPSGKYVTRQALFSGIQFDWIRSYFGMFEKTDIYNYLNNIFMKEILPSKKELGVAPVTPPAKEPEAPAPVTPPAKEASEGFADEEVFNWYFSRNAALEKKLSTNLPATFEYMPMSPEEGIPPCFKVTASTAAGLQAVLSKIEGVAPLDRILAITRSQKDGNDYFLSLPMAEKIVAACEAEPEKKMKEVFIQATKRSPWRR